MASHSDFGYITPAQSTEPVQYYECNINAYFNVPELLFSTTHKKRKKNSLNFLILSANNIQFTQTNAFMQFNQFPCSVSIQHAPKSDLSVVFGEFGFVLGIRRSSVISRTKNDLKVRYKVHRIILHRRTAPL